jgi:hypothetical protein
LLRQQGRQVLMLERQQFPRFSIGESLLPQSMEYIEAAGLLQDVVEAGFQYKNGAAFVPRRAAAPSSTSATSFRRAGAPPTRCSAPTSTRCWPTAPSAWAPKCAYRHEVLAVDVRASGRQRASEPRRTAARLHRRGQLILLDASGFGRLLPRLLDLESPSGFPVRGAIFCHVQDRIPADAELRPQQDPGHRAPRSRGRVVLDHPVLQRPLLAGRGRAQPSSSRNTKAPTWSACRPS